MIIYPIVAVIISVILNLYITISSNPYLIYLDLSSDSNVTCRVYFDYGYGYKKSNYKVIKIEKNTELKKYRIVFPYKKIKKFKFTNFSTKAKLNINKKISIYNNKCQIEFNEYISHENSNLINYDANKIKLDYSGNTIMIVTQKNLQEFEYTFEKSLKPWVLKDLLNNHFYYNTLKLFIVFILVIYSINLTKK